MTNQHLIAMKLTELIAKAPAGGVFHDATTSLPITDDGGPSRFALRCPDAEPTAVFEITITPLP